MQAWANLKNEFEHALLTLIDDWPDHAKKINAIACGMIGARKGWVEAVYKMVPCKPFQVEVTVAPVEDPRLNLFVIPGLVQLNPSEDVMRGEETQISSVLGLSEYHYQLLLAPVQPWVFSSFYRSS